MNKVDRPADSSYDYIEYDEQVENDLLMRDDNDDPWYRWLCLFPS